MFNKLKSSNPSFRNDVFGRQQTWDSFHGSTASPDAGLEAVVRPASPKTGMTVAGTVNKSFFLLALCVTTAVIGWQMSTPEGQGFFDVKVSPLLLMLGGGLTGLVLALIAGFKPQTSPVTAPMYALAEGFFVGGASSLYAQMYGNLNNPGSFVPDATIVLQAALGTFGAFAAMLTAYSTKLIKPTERFKSIVITATLGFVFLYGISFLLRLFGVDIPMLHQAGPVSLVICALAIVVASLNLILDFDFIAQGPKNGTPKWGEWYGSMSLIVTLVWLYVEFLRLLYIIKAMAEE